MPPLAIRMDPLRSRSDMGVSVSPVRGGAPRNEDPLGRVPDPGLREPMTDLLLLWTAASPFDRSMGIRPGVLPHLPIDPSLILFILITGIGFHATIYSAYFLRYRVCFSPFFSACIVAGIWGLTLFLAVTIPAGFVRDSVVVGSLVALPHLVISHIMARIWFQSGWRR